MPIVKDYFHGKQGIERCLAVSTKAVLKRWLIPVPKVKDYFHGKQGLERCSAVSTEAVLKEMWIMGTYAGADYNLPSVIVDSEVQLSTPTLTYADENGTTNRKGRGREGLEMPLCLRKDIL